MRVILYTGKGGVGKTTVAVATALRLADMGRRVLVMSTDPAHSLGDAVGVSLGNDPVAVAPNCDALEIDALIENDRAWENLRAYLGSLLVRGDTDLATDEMLLLPGLGELFSLLRILDFADSGQYDVLVVDCAPTGETLSLLKYPERLDRLFRIALPTKRALLKVLGKPLEKLTRIPMPEDRLFDDVMNLLDRLTQLGRLLRDGEVTTLRLVTTPERIVVAETRRAHTWLMMYGFVVDAVILNRVYPEAALGGYFAPWAESQATGVRLIEESFRHLPVHRVPLWPGEIVGLDALLALSNQIYGDYDPVAVNYRGEFTRVTRDDDRLLLHLKLPLADKAALDLQQEDADLLLAYRNEHRRIALPDSLVGLDVVGATFRDEELVVAFASPDR